MNWELCVWCREELELGETIAAIPPFVFHYACFCEYENQVRKLKEAKDAEPKYCVCKNLNPGCCTCGAAYVAEDWCEHTDDVPCCQRHFNEELKERL